MYCTLRKKFHNIDNLMETFQQDIFVDSIFFNDLLFTVKKIEMVPPYYISGFFPG